MEMHYSWLLVAIFVLAIIISGIRLEQHAGEATSGEPAAAPGALPDNPNDDVDYSEDRLDDIWLAGGCFWGVEAYLARVHGVAETTVGYANGNTANPSYRDVIYNNTGHAETVHVRYSPERVTLESLLEHFFTIIDPTVENRQGNDVGTQYRTAIFYQDQADREVIERVLAVEQEKYDRPIVTEVERLDGFYAAEEYHQDYLEKNPGGYCHVDFSPLEKDESAGVPAESAENYEKPDDETIRERLTDLQYAVTQEDATEQPFANKYWDNHEQGLYVDVVTGEPLFLSTNKFDSGTGWPSFTKPVSPNAVTQHDDNSLGMTRTEVRSRIGDSHLGHVFEDGPAEEGGLRYCINSAALRFVPLEDMKEEGYSNYIDAIRDE